MPALLHKLNYTYAEYLGFEASSNVKHEFLDGQIYAMAGGTPEHLRVRTPTGLTTYPDVTVICGPRELDDIDQMVGERLSFTKTRAQSF